MNQSLTSGYLCEQVVQNWSFTYVHNYNDNRADNLRQYNLSQLVNWHKITDG